MTDLPTTMEGVLLTGHGGFDKLAYRTDLPVPSPRRGEVVVAVHAAGVNNTDLNTRLAWYSKGQGEAGDASWSGEPIAFPRIQGIDVCGAIAAVGDGVAPSRLGERVLVEPCLLEEAGEPLPRPSFLGSECDGGFAQFVRVPGRHAFPVQSPLSSVELASFPCSYSTAENMLSRAHVTTDDHVLVTGAAGGVGSAAVQLARARGARVTAVTSPAKAATVIEIGADATVPRETNLVAALGKDAVDVVVDLVGGPEWPTLLEVLKPFGRYAVAGAVAGADVPLDLRTLYLKDLTFVGCTVLGEGVFAGLVRRIEQAQIKPLVAQTFKLRDIHRAQKAFVAKNFVGKIVLEVPQP